MTSRKPKKPDTEALKQQFGKLPPQAVDLEEAVLGGIMLEKDAFPIVMEILPPEAFYKDSNQRVYAACRRLFERSEPIDILTLCNELKTSGDLDQIGGPYAVSKLGDRVGSSANIEYHARIVFQKYIQREIIRVSSNSIKQAFEDSEADVFTMLDESQKTIDTIFQLIHKSANKSWDQMVEETYQQLRKAVGSDSHLFGMPTGLHELDRITSGRVPGDLIIIAGRPSMGKTTRMLQEVYNLAVLDNQPVGVFSLEMPFEQLIIKMLANDIQYNSNLIRSGKMDDYRQDALLAASDKLKRAPIYLNDISGLHILELKAIARQWKSKFGIRAAYVDYLQLIDNKIPGRTREQEVSEISKSLKTMAKDMKISVIALSQLSRGVENRQGNRKPQLSDLRESGGIEQDADVVEFVYRPEYYNIMQDEDGNDMTGIMELIVAKNRNGATGKALFKFDKEISRLRNIEKKGEPEKNIPVRDFSTGIGPNRRLESLDAAGEDIPF